MRVISASTGRVGRAVGKGLPRAVRDVKLPVPLSSLVGKQWSTHIRVTFSPGRAASS